MINSKIKYKCSICGETAVYKIKNEEIYYCKEHAKEFFNVDSLIEIKSRIIQSNNEALKLKKKLDFD
jgi:ribosomal protein L37AE/L43A